MVLFGVVDVEERGVDWGGRRRDGDIANDE